MNNRAVSVNYINALIAIKEYKKAQSCIFSHLQKEDTYHYWDLLSKCKEKTGELSQSINFALQALTCNPTHKKLLERYERLKKLI